MLFALVCRHAAEEATAENHPPYRIKICKGRLDMRVTSFMSMMTAN